MDKISDIARRLDGILLRRAQRARGIAVWVRTWLVLCGALVAGICQFIPLSKFNPVVLFDLSASQVAGIMALACVFLGSIILIRFEQDAPGELVDCAEVFGLVERVKATLDDLSSTQRQVMRGAGLYDAVKVMREVVELCISEPEFNEELIAERMLETSIHSLLTVLGFQPDDRWTVCIFKAENAKGKPVTLSVLAHRRYEPCDRGKTRVWQSGEENVGLAFLKKEELIIENSSTPDVANTYRPSQDNRRAHDANLYVSSVTVPVLVGKDDRAWGVVVATSSKPGHFRHGDRSQLHPAEAMRVLGSMLELAVTRTYK